MSVDKYLQLALKTQKIEPEINIGVNQALVLGEAKEILQRMYEEYICLYMRTDDDRDHFLQSLATDLASVFPRKKKRKSKSRKKSKKAKSRFGEDGIFYWKTREFAGLSDQSQAAWVKKMTAAYPWLGFTEETEASFKVPGAIRYWNTKEFKSKKRKGGVRYMSLYREQYPQAPLNPQDYDAHLMHKYPKKYASYKSSLTDESLDAQSEED